MVEEGSSHIIARGISKDMEFDDWFSKPKDEPLDSCFFEFEDILEDVEFDEWLSYRRRLNQRYRQGKWISNS
jgi:hypothetical protein